MLKRFNVYKGLPRSMYVMFFVQVINRFGDFVIPFLTLFLTEKLKLSIGVVGIIVTIGSLLGIPGALIGGKLADTLGRKKTYLIAQLTSALALAFCAFLKTPSLIVIFILISTFFNGAVRPSINAILIDVLPAEKRQLGFSLSYLGINLGVAIGPMIAGFLFKNYLPIFFLGDSLTSFIAVSLVLFHIKETNPIENKNTLHNEKKEKGNIFQVLLRRPEIMIFLIINILYSAVYTQHRFSLPLMINKLFLEKGAQYFGYLMSVNALTVITLSVIIIKLTKKNHSLTNVIIAGIFYAIGFGVIGIIRAFPLFVLSTICWTIGEILMATNVGVYLADKSPVNFRARLSAVGNLTQAAGAVLGTSLMGKYISLAGINAVWKLTFELALVSAVLILALRLFVKRKHLI